MSSANHNGGLVYVGHLLGECAYLPDRRSSLLLLEGELPGALYRQMLDAGFRRHGSRIYRPDCPDCRECHVLRVPVGEFSLRRTQRRIWRRGIEDFRITLHEPAYSTEKEALYREYLRTQHGRRGGQPLQGEEEYHDFFVATLTRIRTVELQFHLGELLAGVGLIDFLGDALSSVYFYFHPTAARYSPGIFSMLYEIELAREAGLQYYYPGFYIPDCQSMNYKLQLRPCEIRRPPSSPWFPITGQKKDVRTIWGNDILSNRGSFFPARREKIEPDI